jgi:Fe-S-cluster containining protein
MCAACCKQMKVELSVIDVLREPRLAPLARNAMVELVARDTMGQPVGPPLRRKALVMITGGPEGRCQFLGEAVPGEHPELCKMHPTRPGACVLFAAGSDECQKERRKMGLPPLLPVGQGPPAWKPPALSSLA